MHKATSRFTYSEEGGSVSDADVLKLELSALFVVTNLVAFALGMLLVMIEFDVQAYLKGLELVHLFAMIAGPLLFGIGVVDVIMRLNRALS
jgi:hypothetical protein